jgi:tetratricopeptide (TPR) repeat protein
VNRGRASRRVVGLVFASAWLFASAAQAQPTPPAQSPAQSPVQSLAARRAGSAKSNDLAREHLARANRLEKQERYREAAAAYEDAYAFAEEEKPGLLFNAGLMYWKGDDQATGVVYFEQYVARDPNGEVGDVARAFIADYRRRPRPLRDQRRFRPPGRLRVGHRPRVPSPSSRT